MNSDNHVGRLLITADDVCVCSAIDTAVIDLARKGVVTNAAVMANWQGLSSINELIETDCLISYHYNISSGVPISKLSAVRTLLNSEGRFHEPSSLKLSTDNSLNDCIERYNNTIIPKFDTNQVILELKNQAQYLSEKINQEVRFSSFHHDLDKHPIIQTIFNKEKIGLLASRQISLKRAKLSGFEYLLMGQYETFDNYLSKIKKCLKRGIKKSALSGGIPYEIALHPAKKTDGLSKFTIYKQERLVEYRVWDSVCIKEIFESGTRTGFYWTFPYEIDQEIES